MPRKEIHILIPFIFILFIWFIVGKRFLALFTGWTFLIAWFLFLIGSLAPDLIEPAQIHSFRHRRFFHSWKLLKIISILTIIVIILWLIFKFSVLLYIGSFLLGYIIHLLLDSMTKMGLPSGNSSTNLTKDKNLIDK
jgi:phosphatidylserine synthase